MTEDQFGQEPTTAALLSRHLHRIGADKTVAEDAVSRLQVAMLRDFVALLRCALDDEGVDRDVARRVTERVIYGAVPQPAVVERMLTERQIRLQEMVDRWPSVNKYGPPPPGDAVA